MSLFLIQIQGCIQPITNLLIKIEQKILDDDTQSF